ncbi:uncharacterized protein F4822DRAFT_237559 [Hypoxylon trugodes]|uniref:uncharacterized protein n=1 Tax=Hypoxylon trugodes TaxID=326681 RepID=UPI00219B7AB4|nr:uncharacterized protein F4822DRAFT_237559 [Hypoxylon trugodes]KAI1388191.1 hypothetical protein F4822DRAFT_237559 [Hypoxylon trugodes]
MSASSQSSTSPTGVVDPLDLLDFSEYDTVQYQSPSASPATANKAQFARASAAVSTPTTMPSTQTLTGPSHKYDQYKQQTPFVPGAVASTLAINQSNNQITGYTLDYMAAEMGSNEEMFDFNSAPSQNMDLDFESQQDPSFFFSETINPNAIGGESQTMQSPTVPSQSSSVGRMYPGMHQQAALAKAQAQQRQQQHLIQQQQRQNQAKQHRPKAPMPSDPIVEQKITQLLNSMRSKAGASPSDGGDSPLMQLPRPKKEEDEMDEDERLLASEEGKKLSSKERRQLRNKVSARAFRSRRKEYITQLESEIASKVTENGDLRAQNRALVEENRRLSDLTRMLLSSQQFSNFLDHLSSNPAAIQQQQQQQQQPEQRQSESRQVPKDINPFAGQQNHQQQIGMVMMPEQTMDFSMLNLNSDAFNYQPQVFTVLDTPDMPVIDTEALAGKSSNFVGESFTSDAEKTDAPVLEVPVLSSAKSPEPFETPTGFPISQEAPADLDADIYDDEISVSSQKPVELNTDSLTSVDIFGGIESDKALARLELVGSEEDTVAIAAARRVERLAASLESVMARLDMLTIGL